MNERVKLLSDEASKLTPDERLELMTRITLTFADQPPEIDPEWEAEIERRVRNADADGSERHDAFEAIAALRQRCG
jgi:putative addiction module component (TIGR02574 family)